MSVLSLNIIKQNISNRNTLYNKKKCQVCKVVIKLVLNKSIIMSFEFYAGRLSYVLDQYQLLNFGFTHRQVGQVTLGQVRLGQVRLGQVRLGYIRLDCNGYFLSLGDVRVKYIVVAGSVDWWALTGYQYTSISISAPRSGAGQLVCL